MGDPKKVSRAGSLASQSWVISIEGQTERGDIWAQSSLIFYELRNLSGKVHGGPPGCVEHTDWSSHTVLSRHMPTGLSVSTVPH